MYGEINDSHSKEAKPKEPLQRTTVAQKIISDDSWK